jgi:uncharacterized nucleotidyltransferase DUF6036
MAGLAEQATSDGRVYFTGGVTALLMKWRSTTIDIDIKMVPEQDALFRALPMLKEALEINVELAAPDQFIPALPEWEERSQLISKVGLLSFFHYDFYSQALAKIERGHSRDVTDVAAMFERGLIEPQRLLDYFAKIEPALYRYPAIDPRAFRRAVETIVHDQW